jgi:hypothetical protein
MGLYIERDVKAVNVDHGTIFLRHCLIDSELVFITDDDMTRRADRGMRSTTESIRAYPSPPLLHLDESRSKLAFVYAFLILISDCLYDRETSAKWSLDCSESEMKRAVSQCSLLISCALNNSGNHPT